MTDQMDAERRRFIRPETLNLLDYLHVDEQGQQGEYAMGRTLNVSEGGMLMETHIKLPEGSQVMITIGLHDQLVDVMGKVIRSSFDDGRYNNGIEFFHCSDDDKVIIKRYVKAFNEYVKASRQK
jgi:ribosomal protein S4E